ncbi:response regulator [Agromyces sp. ZXT2-6]|uniref:response regulator n=1 Tax=Agromyces sp. ZXT2-6 TaxID=3461153 RepID=UPI004054B656
MAADADLLLDGRLVLLVDDDPTVLEVCRSYLEQAGFRVLAAADAFAALDRVARDRPDLVVLDRMLPGLDGIEVCRRIRSTSTVPVIMLTALGEEADRIAGLEAGVDDYLAKPFSPRELTLRVRSVLRRALAVEAVAASTAGSPAAVIERGPLRIDTAAHTVDLDDRRVNLTQREFELLAFLARRPGTVFSREDLLSGVWGWTHGDLSTVTVHVRRLREKIEADAANPRLLVTVWGYGYRFDDPGEAT